MRVCLYEISAEELASLRSSGADGVRAILSGPPNRASCELGKAWAGLNYLFQMGGYDLEQRLVNHEGAPQLEDGSYRLIGAHQVGLLADNFEWEGRATHLAAGYEPEEMALQGIYPSVIWRREPEASLEFLLSFVPKLRAFVTHAADTERAVLSVFS